MIFSSGCQNQTVGSRDLIFCCDSSSIQDNVRLSVCHNEFLKVKRTMSSVLLHNMHYSDNALCILCIMHIMHYAYYALCILCIMHIMHYAHYAYYPLCTLCIMHIMHITHHAHYGLCTLYIMHIRHYAHKALCS